MRAFLTVMFVFLAVYFVDNQFYDGKYTAPFKEAARILAQRY